MYVDGLAFDHINWVRMHWNTEFSYTKLRFIHVKECKICHRCSLWPVLLYSECLMSIKQNNFLCEGLETTKYVHLPLSSYITLEFCVWTYFIDLFPQIFFEVYNLFTLFLPSTKACVSWTKVVWWKFFLLDLSEWKSVLNVGCWAIGLLHQCQ